MFGNQKYAGPQWKCSFCQPIQSVKPFLILGVAARNMLNQSYPTCLYKAFPKRESTPSGKRRKVRLAIRDFQLSTGRSKT